MSLADSLKQERKDRIQLGIYSYLMHLLVVDNTPPEAALQNVGEVILSAMEIGVQNALTVWSGRATIDKPLDIIEDSFAAAVVKRRKAR